jgi:hypothetical protein
VLTHAPRQPLPWLIFDVRQKKMNPILATHYGMVDFVFFGAPFILVIGGLNLVAAAKKWRVVSFVLGFIVFITWGVAWREIRNGGSGDKVWAWLYLLVSLLFLFFVTFRSTSYLGDKRSVRISRTVTVIVAEFVVASIFEVVWQASI